MININKSWSADVNFWKSNPQITLHNPYSKLYNKDKSKDKSKSSIDMWTIFFLSDPDSTKNTFYRIPYSERLALIKENYNKDFDENNKLIIECLEAYPQLILSAVERSLKEEIDSMVQRSQLLRNTVYTLDKTVIDGNKSLIMKGTATQLDSMRSKTTKLYENYEKLQQKFMKQQDETRIRGGRKETISEKNLL